MSIQLAIQQVRSALKQERKRTLLSAQEVCEALEWAPGKLARIEEGPSAISVADLQALLFHYRVTDQNYAAELMETLKGSEKSAWWQAYEDVYISKFLKTMEFESSSNSIRCYQGRVIPGLLQTPEYASALMSYPDKVRTTRGVEVRMRRQHVLKHDGHRFSFAIFESLLDLSRVNIDLMRGQLLRIKEVAINSGAKVRIVPSVLMGKTWRHDSFVLYDLPDKRQSTVLTLERSTEDKVIEQDSSYIEKYRMIHDEISEVALSETDSINLIDQLLKRV